ncbi:GNAT family N-acetyltransferase [Falsiphaeobacter marinintestinus]|uniref:GNAT family N-acetyltransferase n=1 Tax=Falsiphaeobacter marinintestinus TaxID=1492905 RepID=UPI0011B5EF3D|nr:GNAT family N-acetyltransferase [Phaeobacter marinintestinus]
MTGFTLPIPVIETERLLLRGPREDDFEAHATFMASDRSGFVGGPQDRWGSWRGLLGQFGHWALRGFGFWTVTARKTGEPLGKTGFIDNDGWDETELGWHVYEQAEGKGIAFEAVQAVRAYGAEKRGLDGVISYIDPANTRSVKLAERLGATFERTGEVVGKPCHVYRHPKVRGVA